MRARVVVGVLLALTVAGVATVLSQREVRLAGTNHVRTVDFTVEVPGDAEVCQPATSLAAGAGAARLLVATHGAPTPPLAVRFLVAGEVLAHGRLAGGQSEGPLTVPFARPVGDLRTATACVRNGGVRPILLAGDIATPANGARVDDGAVQGVVAFAYPRAQSASWWSQMGETARRFGVGKASLLGTWTLPFAALVLLATWVAVIRLLLREQPR